ncbi:MAG: type II secretion system secretin GspD [Deltaproteobacteria bacterium]
MKKRIINILCLMTLVVAPGVDARSQDAQIHNGKSNKNGATSPPNGATKRIAPVQLLEPPTEEGEDSSDENPDPAPQENPGEGDDNDEPIQTPPLVQEITPAPRQITPAPAPVIRITPSPLSAPQEEVVNLQAEMDIRDMIQTISEITGETFILDESVRGKQITIITPRGGFKERNAIRLFEAILDLNGFTIIKKDSVNKVIPKRDIKGETLPIEVGKGYGASSDRFVTRLVPLKNLNAADITNTLKPLVSKEGDILLYPGLNTLIIVDTVSNLNKLLKIIDSIDQDTVVEFIKIENSDALDIAEKLSGIFGAGAGGPSIQQNVSPRQPRNVPIQQAPQSPGGLSQAPVSGLKVLTDERTNSLIVIAYPDDMQKIKSIIAMLDVKIDQPEQGIYVIRLQNADAEQVVSVISGLIGGGGGGGGVTGLGSQLGQFGTSNRRNRNQGGSVFVSSGRQNTGGGGFGFQGRQGGNFGFGQQGGGDQTNRGQENQGVFSSVVAEADGIRITADPATNSVIIVGSRRDYESVKGVIDQLDIRRRQVFVEAAILEISLEKLKSLGGNFSLGAIINNDNLGFGGTALPGIPSLLGAAASSSSLVSAVGSISGLFLGVIGDTVDPDGSGPIPPVPSFSALYQALSSLTDVNVLSTPSLLTTDNEEAEIIVADVIPFPTGSTVAETGVTVQTIERQPVGIRLAITPQISEGDYLTLNILTEVSAVRDAPAGLNTAQFGIATTTRTADSSVVVKNGQTIVIGGLVQDRESTAESKVPLIGDIPFFGNFFKFKSRRSSKINLMILLTPRIVESEIQMQSILEEKQKQNMLLQQKELN